MRHSTHTSLSTGGCYTALQDQGAKGLQEFNTPVNMLLAHLNKSDDSSSMQPVVHWVAPVHAHNVRSHYISTSSYKYDDLAHNALFITATIETKVPQKVHSIH